MLRFAQSPTRDINIGDLRIAIFNYILSKQSNEELLIRIDDLEKEKNIEGKEKEILEILSLFSIESSRVIYQSENLKYHQKLTMQLMGQKKAFACFCGEDKLNELKEKAESKGKVFSYDGFCETLSDETVLNCNAPFTVRIKKPDSNIKFTDLLKGDFDYRPFEVDSFVVLNHDKTPTNSYACAVDDMLYDVSTVIRDDKFASNTPKQIHIRKQLNYEKEINYIHIPKLKEETSIKSLIDEGFLPSAIANYLVLIGNETPKEIFSLEEAIEWFDIKSLSKDELEFDIEKLRLINKKHLEEIDELRLSKILGFADTDIGKLAKLFLDESCTIKELKSKIEPFFTPKSTLIDFEEEFVELKVCLNDAPFFEDYKKLELYLIEKTGLKDDKLQVPLRYILTGLKSGPDISNVYPLIKKLFRRDCKMIDAFIGSIFTVILSVVTLYKWVIIISAILSWVRPDPYNPIVQMLYRLTEPAYALVRRFIPTVFGGMDLAPLIVIFVLIFLETFLGRLFIGM